MDGNAKTDGTTTPSAQPAEPAALQAPEAAVPRRVIRTFATDMATLNGAPPPEAKPIPQEQIHAPGSGPSLAESVSKIPIPTIQNEPARIKVAAKPLISDKTAGMLSDFVSGLFKKKDSDVRVTTLSASASAWASAPSTRSPSPTAATPAPVQTDANEREEVLTRLRDKASAKGAEPVVLPPVFPSPKEEASPTPTWTPKPADAPAPADDERLRTYSADFSTRVDNQQASAFSVLAAQADATRSDAPVLVQKKSGGHGLAFALAGTVLIVGGSLAIYFAYQYMDTGAPVPILTFDPQTLVAGDDSFTLTGTGSQLMDALAARANEPLTIGNVRIAYLEVSTTTATGVVTTSEPGGVLLKAMELPAPDILMRNIGSESSVGIIHAGDQTRPFFVLGARSYERTFAGMLAWEPTMGKDLAALYPAYPVTPAPILQVATSTATTTKAADTASSTPPKPVFVYKFTDAVVESHDVRVLKDEEGRTVLMYGYRDRDTLIIARNETAFSLLLARLSATGAN